jgi:uncharacterized C2H2 Zn-finger protein
LQQLASPCSNCGMRTIAYSRCTQRSATFNSLRQLTAARISSQHLTSARISFQQLSSHCISLRQVAAVCINLHQFATAMKRCSVVLREPEETGESPLKRLRRPTYPCPNCDKVFNNRTSRARHVKKYHAGGRIRAVDRQFHFKNDVLKSFVDARCGGGDTIACI